MRSLNAFLKIIFDRPSSVVFFLGVVLGLAFSISVILSTFGLMDGFENSLKRSLRKSGGDISFKPRFGTVKEFPRENFDKTAITRIIGLKQEEGYLLDQGFSRGVQLRSITNEDLSLLFERGIHLKQNEILIGESLGTKFKLNQGQTLKVAFPQGNALNKQLPRLREFIIAGFFTHGLHEKDSRLVYLPFQDNEKEYNLFLSYLKGETSLKDIEYYVEELRDQVGDRFEIRPFWKDFSPLIKAVEVEKMTITFILQLIVLIAVFNAIAFFKYSHEKKIKHLFLLQVLGVSRRETLKHYSFLVITMWTVACFLSFLFYKAFIYALNNFPFLNLPGEVYYLTHLEVENSWQNVALIFLSALVWLLLANYFSLNKMLKQNIMGRLKEEFV